MEKSCGDISDMERYRNEIIAKIQKVPRFDCIIIGGGATGLGAAVDAAARGLKTLVIEQFDFAKATSSRSTKLIHGGLRYLEQGNLSLVTEALKERGLLRQNAPHLIGSRGFLVPNYEWWEGPFYGFGLKVYDALAGSLKLEKSHHLSKKETLKAIPTLKQEGLKGGVIYHDGQFDDARLAITLVKTCQDLGGLAINYMKVTRFIKQEGQIAGVVIEDYETKKSMQIYGKCVINAGGIFSDTVCALDDPAQKKHIQLSQGVHLVLDRSFLKSEHAILVPHTKDNRVLFLVPWLGKVLIGTTDTPVENPEEEPIALKEEIDFILEESSRYLERAPKSTDVLSVFAGQRPLAKIHTGESTSKIARNHVISLSTSGLLSIYGGKWTTYRKMAEDVIDQAILSHNLPKEKCKTEHLKLHGYEVNLSPEDPLSTYGSNLPLLHSIMKEDKSYSDLMHKDLPYQMGEVVFAVRYEMARRLEDVLSRRTRSLLLSTKASLEIAHRVASLMAKELGMPKEWVDTEVKTFSLLAKNYTLNAYNASEYA